MLLFLEAITKAQLVKTDLVSQINVNQDVNMLSQQQNQHITILINHSKNKMRLIFLKTLMKRMQLEIMNQQETRNSCNPVNIITHWSNQLSTNKTKVFKLLNQWFMNRQFLAKLWTLFIWNQDWSISKLTKRSLSKRTESFMPMNKVKLWMFLELSLRKLSSTIDF